MATLKVKTKISFGKDALSVLRTLDNVNVVIFTDSFMVQSGTAAQIESLLGSAKEVSIFDKILPDPPIELVTEGLAFIAKAHADVVIALGGGSSIDAAKATVLMAKRAGINPNIQLIAIPTTSGTGSEVTNFAVISDTERGTKVPLQDDEMLPDLAVLDPSLVVSAPPRITADTGFDVITHALEAYLSRNANDYADALSEKSLVIAFKYLPIAYKNGADLSAREKLHCASCLAGMAFNAVGLGVNHGIAHQLGARFHIPHGRANAMLLPHVALFNADLPSNFGSREVTRTSRRLARIAYRIGLTGDTTNDLVLALIRRLNYMMEMTDTPRTLAEAGVIKEEYEAAKPAIIEAALKDACTACNPISVTAADIEEILSGIAKW